MKFCFCVALLVLGSDLSAVVPVPKFRAPGIPAEGHVGIPSFFYRDKDAPKDPAVEDKEFSKDMTVEVQRLQKEVQSLKAKGKEDAATIKEMEETLENMALTNISYIDAMLALFTNDVIKVIDKYQGFVMHRLSTYKHMKERLEEVADEPTTPPKFKKVIPGYIKRLDEIIKIGKA